MTETNSTAIDLYRELVILDGGEGRTTSDKIAARFNRAHSNVLRSIDRIVMAMKSQEFCLQGEIFRECFVMDRRGRTRRQFSVSKDGFILLAMRFDGVTALGWQLKFIAAFNWLCDQLREREENNRLIASFDIKNRESIEAGPHHGLGLQRRKVEKQGLEAEGRELTSKVQSSLLPGNSTQQ